MEYRRFGSTYVVRLDPGEEIVEKLLWLTAVERITLASVSGLGNVDNVTLGLFHPDTKQFHANLFCADFEIVSLTGNLSMPGDRPYAHLHMAVADESSRCYGGHLNRAVISSTAEIFVHVIDGAVTRQPDPKVGLNLLKFYP